MSKSTVLLCSFAIMTFAATAFATEIVDPNDPAMFENGSGCAATWCASSGLALDPISGLTTVQYVFKSTIPVVLAGDVKITEPGGAVGDVIRFENISSIAVAFIFSADIGGGLAADVGLPSTYQTLTKTIAEDGSGNAVFTPSSVEPGYSAVGVSNSLGTYGLIGSPDVPEPASISLVGGTLLIGIGFMRRRQIWSRT